MSDPHVFVNFERFYGVLVGGSDPGKGQGSQLLVGRVIMPAGEAKKEKIAGKLIRLDFVRYFETVLRTSASLQGCSWVLWVFLCFQ